MAEQKREHPADDDLAAYALGRLRGPARVQIEQHVAECDTCCQMLGNVTEDTLVERLRASDAASEMPDTDAGPAESSADDPDAIPRELREHPRYRVLRRLGRGGMGEVFQAEHRLMDRCVALKLIHPKFTDHPEAVNRFRREVQATARLSHPNIVTAHDAEQAGDLHFLVMEYVDGASLDRVVARHGPLPVLNACNYIRQAATGLQHAHERGMVHRDIKPQNLMLTRRGRVKVLDLGLARLGTRDVDGPTDDGHAPTDDALTRAGTTMGTPDYMAPEQIRDSRQADIRADIYSLGCTFYFLLTGRPPFADYSTTEKLAAHLHRQPPSLNNFRTDVPPDVQQILDRMLAKEVDNRFQTPSELAEALRPFSRQQAGEATPVVSPQKTTLTPAESRAVPGEAEDGGGPGDNASVRGIQAPNEVARRSRGGSRPQNVRYLVTAGVFIILGLAAWWIAPVMNPFGGGDLNGGRDVSVSPETSRDEAGGALVDTPSGGKSRVLMVLPYHDFWYEDYAPVRQRLAAAAVDVKIASSQPGVARSDKEHAQRVPVDVTLNEVAADQFDAVVFVGSSDPIAIEYLGATRQGRAARTLIQDMLDSNRYVTSLCGGTAVLADAGVLHNKSAADVSYLPDEFKIQHRGIRWEPQHVVRSSNLILTGGDYEFADQFADALVALLRGP